MKILSMIYITEYELYEPGTYNTYLKDLNKIEESIEHIFCSGTLPIEYKIQKLPTKLNKGDIIR